MTQNTQISGEVSDQKAFQLILEHNNSNPVKIGILDPVITGEIVDRMSRMTQSIIPPCLVSS